MASHRIAGRRLSRKKDQRKALMRSQAVSLLTNERIKTTLSKAKETRIMAEKLITYGKKGGLHNRRFCLLYTSTRPRDKRQYRKTSSA